MSTSHININKNGIKTIKHKNINITHHVSTLWIALRFSQIDHWIAANHTLQDPLSVERAGLDVTTKRAGG